MIQLPLISIYNYYPELFDDFQLPAELDVADVRDNILLELGEQTPTPQRPDLLRGFIGVWSRRLAPVWQHLLDTTKYDYDPLSNYDRHEEWIDTGTSSGSSNGATVGSGTEQVQAYDSINWEDSSHNDNSSSSNTETSANGQSKHVGHLYGNIGVTTSQQMVEEQRRVVRFSVVDEIVRDFAREFMIQIY